MKVGLYIPCFNAKETIQLCLEGVFRQTYPLKEVLVVDDGSTDKTVEIVSRYPVKLVRHATNRGLAAARNTAIKNLKTEFIASLDADCIPDLDWLKYLIERFNLPKIAGVGGKLLEENCSSVFDIWRSVHMKQYWESTDNRPPFLFGSNTIFRRAAIVKAGVYNENYKNNYEDVDICERLNEKRYSLIYEPKAIVRHFKNDDICSILNSYWNWHLGYYKKKKYHSNLKKFILKIKDNIGLANRYIEDDIQHKRYELLYLDFLLALHHSLKDFAYFISQDDQNISDSLNSTLISHWLSLLDLTFFYHLDSTKKNFSTIIPKKDAFLQNLLALDLILGNLVQKQFKSTVFKKILYKHLYLSVYKINDNYLLDKLLNLVELHKDWSALFKKRQSNLNPEFLKNLSLNFQKWLEVLTYRFSNITQMIILAAEKTDSFALKKGACNENK